MMRQSFATLTLAIALAASSGAQPQRDREQALRHLRAGQEALESERFEQAELEFGAALALDPSLELAHYGLGQVGMAVKRYDRAVASFLQCRDVFHKNMSETVGDWLLDERRLDEQIRGLRDLRQALQSGRVRSINPTASIQRYDSQISQLEGLRRRANTGSVPTPPYISTALGSAYFRTGLFADAEREWRAAAAVDPAIGEVHNNLAVVCMLTGRYDEAEREIGLAEKAGFRVSDGLKRDIKSKRKTLSSSAGTQDSRRGDADPATAT